MRRPLWIILGVSISTALVFLGLALHTIWFSTPVAQVKPVPAGDQEIAFIHTSTNLTNWERFVAGAFLTARRIPGLEIDDRNAFPDETTVTPELIIRMPQSTQQLRIRWYKLAGSIREPEWVEALANRNPPPIALIGGGSSDRAIDLASALAQQRNWLGPEPLLLIMQATAIDSGTGNNGPSPPLMSIYPGRTFRFCFNNLQIAQAVMDFVERRPELRPLDQPLPTLAGLPFLAISPWAGAISLAPRPATIPQAHTILWQDDPYSIDLAQQFHRVIHGLNREDSRKLRQLETPPQQSIPYSIGAFYRANRWEAAAAERLIRELPTDPGHRSLLILPAVATPARRVLFSLCNASPLIGRNLVAVTGDSIGLNTLYRDADFAWNARSVPVPLVGFTHANPVAWDEPDAAHKYPLLRPTGTEDAYRNADLLEQVVKATFLQSPQQLPDADGLNTALRSLQPPFFEENGERLAGIGEYIMWLQPIFAPRGTFSIPVFVEADLRVFYRTIDGQWHEAAQRLQLGRGDTHLTAEDADER